MNNHIKLLNNHKKKLGGSNIIYDSGFPNIIKNVEINKKTYEYNIDNIIEKEKIDIKNILLKRREEKKPLIKITDDEDYNLIKKQEQYTTNINIEDLY